MISKRALNCKESPTLAISAKAKAMKKQGKDVIDFGAGQPDFDVPLNLKEAAKAAIDKPNSGKYTAASGTPELKTAIINKFKKDNNLDYKQSQILVSCGAKHSLYNIFQAIIDEGDEVIIPAPYWVSYPEMVELAGGTPIIAQTDDNFKLFASDINDKLSEKTKAIILNSPSNPTGAVIDKAELRKIAEIALQNNILIISDEIYEKIIYDHEHISIASFDEEIKNITITVNGISKAYAAPGWRIGYAAGPEHIIKAMSNIQAQSTSNPASIMQAAAIEALSGSQDEVNIMRDQFRKRRDFIVNALNDIGMQCSLPAGAFYVFPKIPIKDDIQFAKDLLEQKQVAVVPGSPFGKPGYIRMSYAASIEDIQKGIDRIKEFLGNNTDNFSDNTDTDNQ